MSLDPAYTVIDRLGGIAAVSAALNVHRTRVWNWTQPKRKGGSGTGGTIPQRHHLALLDLARSKDVPLTAADFLPLNANDQRQRAVA